MRPCRKNILAYAPSRIYALLVPPHRAASRNAPAVVEDIAPRRRPRRRPSAVPTVTSGSIAMAWHRRRSGGIGNNRR